MSGRQKIPSKKLSQLPWHLVITLIILSHALKPCTIKCQFAHTFYYKLIIKLKHVQVVSTYKSGHRNLFSRYRVDREKFSQRVEWAAKIFSVKSNLTPRGHK